MNNKQALKEARDFYNGIPLKSCPQKIILALVELLDESYLQALDSPKQTADTCAPCCQFPL